MKKKNINISHTSYSIIDKWNKKISFRKARDLTFNDLTKSCDVGLSTVVLKKKILRFVAIMAGMIGIFLQI